MHKITYLFLLGTCCAFPQVGVNTTQPTAMLDVNGNARIRGLASTSSSTIAKDSIMAADSFGNVQLISAKMVVQGHLKSFVKGGFSSTSDHSLDLISGTAKIPFDQEEFDENEEFTLDSNTFTAKIPGIYAISIQIKAGNGIGVATDFGVAIVKNGNVIARNGFANVGVPISLDTVNVTPPVRSVQTLVKLSQGDAINFQLYSNLTNIGLLGTREDCFFTIQQVQ